MLFQGSCEEQTFQAATLKRLRFLNRIKTELDPTPPLFCQDMEIKRS